MERRTRTMILPSSLTVALLLALPGLAFPQSQPVAIEQPATTPLWRVEHLVLKVMLTRIGPHSPTSLHMETRSQQPS